MVLIQYEIDMKNYIELENTHYLVSSILTWNVKTNGEGEESILISTPAGFKEIHISEKEFTGKMEKAMENSDAEKFNFGVRKMTEALERFVMRIPTSIRAHF